MDNQTRKDKDKHVRINIQQNKSGNQKIKFMRMLSITENYNRKHDLIYKNDLMRAVSKNEIETCKILLESTCNLSETNKNYFFHPLLLAAKKGRYEIMELLLDNGANINVQDKKNFTALHYAIQQRSVDCCDLLLQRGIDINAENKSGDLPLHIASSEGMLEIVEKLLEKTSIPNAKNKKDQTPLHFACMKGNDEILNFLLSKGGRWDLKDVKFCLPLHYAAFKGHYTCCDILVKSSGNRLKEHTNGRDKEKATSLILAAKKGHSYCCQRLNLSDIDAFDSKGNTALHYAASAGFFKTVEALLAMKPNVNAQNKDGNTPLHKAAMQKNLECLKLLVEHLDTNPGLNYSKQSIIHLAALKNCNESLEFLLENPIFKEQINAQDNEGKTALHLALNQAYSESAEVLITEGINCTIADSKGNIPLHIGAGAGLHNICKLLLSGDRVQKINDRNSAGTTALHLAAWEGSVECCKFLLTKGADLSAIDSNGFLPFHVASNKGNLEVIKLFTKKGGGLIIQGVEISGDTPLHLAARKGFYNCCSFLLRNIKKDLILKLNNEEKSALDEAFEAEYDEIFHLILSKIPFPKMIERYNIEQHHPFQSSLHEYMHEALENKREIIQKAIVDSEWWYSGFSSSFCGDGQCLNLVNLTKQNDKLAESIYDKCIESEKSGTKFDFRIFEDSYYVPTGDSGDGYLKRYSPFHQETTGKLREDAVLFKKPTEHPLMVAANKECLNLMQHRLTEAYFHYKWISYMRTILLLSIFFEGVLVIVLGFYLNYIQDYAMIKSLNMTIEDMCSGMELPNDVVYSVKDSWTKIIILFTFLTLMAVAMIITEINLNLKVRNSIFTIISAVRLYRLFGILLLLVPTNVCSYDIAIKETWQWQIGILTLLLCWFHMMHTLNEIPGLSVFMPVTLQFSKSFLRVLLYIILILFIFAFIFHLLLREMAAFETIPVAFIKTTVWVLGDLGYDDTFLNDESPIVYPVLTNIIFLLLVTSVTGFIVNLIITQPTDYLELFREKAVYHKAASRIQLFLKLDTIFSYVRKKYLVCYYKTENKQPLRAKNEDKRTKDVESSINNSKKEDSITETKSSDILILRSILEKLEHIETQLAEQKK